MMENVQNDVGSEPIRIRAHHLLCILGFKGIGYSKEFTENMAGITENILQNTFSFIKVIIGVDCICECCPHCHDEKCNVASYSSNSVMKMDSLALQNLGIQPGTIISSKYIISLAMNLNREEVYEICGKCSWRNDCLFYQEKND